MQIVLKWTSLLIRLWCTVRSQSKWGILQYILHLWYPHGLLSWLLSSRSCRARSDVLSGASRVKLLTKWSTSFKDYEVVASIEIWLVGAAPNMARERYRASTISPRGLDFVLLINFRRRCSLSFLFENSTPEKRRGTLWGGDSLVIHLKLLLIPCWSLHYTKSNTRKIVALAVQFWTTSKCSVLWGGIDISLWNLEE